MRLRKKKASEPEDAPGALSTYVYLAKAGDFAKIGFSRDPCRRVHMLQTANAGVLSLVSWVPGGRGLERHLHQYFVRHWERGEWFRWDPELPKYFKQLGGKTLES